MVSPRSYLLKFLVPQVDYQRSRLSKGTQLDQSKRSYSSRAQSIRSSKDLRTSVTSTRNMEISEDAYRRFRLIMSSGRGGMKSRSSTELAKIKYKKSLPIIKECSFLERRCFSIIRSLTQSVNRSWNTFQRPLQPAGYRRIESICVCHPYAWPK